MKTLVLGNGGREHALLTALSRDPQVGALHAAPGNAGMADLATLHAVEATDPAAVVELARELGADLVVVGPEAPLAAGVSDALREAGFAVFGPSQAAAQLEASKAFAKEVMAAAGVPTAGSRVCTTAAEAAAALDEFGAPTSSRTTAWPRARASWSPPTAPRPSPTPRPASPSAAPWWSRTSWTVPRSPSS